MSDVSLSTREGNKTVIGILKDASKFLECSGNSVATGELIDLCDLNQWKYIDAVLMLG